MCCLFWSIGVNWKCWFWEQWIPSYQMVGCYDWFFQKALDQSVLKGLNHWRKPLDATEIMLGRNSRPKRWGKEWLNETVISRFTAFQHLIHSPLSASWWELLWRRWDAHFQCRGLVVTIQSYGAYSQPQLSESKEFDPTWFRLLIQPKTFIKPDKWHSKNPLGMENRADNVIC